jgi:lysozyme
MAAMYRTPLVVALAGLLAGCGAEGPDVGMISFGLTVCPAGPTIEGVDVSHYDGVIDWAKVRGAGIDFAVMKATEGTGFTDPTYATNWQGSAANGVIRGAYHFFRPAVDPTAQADFFVQTAGVPLSGDLPLTLDLETTDGLSGAQVSQGALTFLQRVEAKTGRTPIVYTSASFMSSIGNPPLGPYLLWVAHWQVNCPNIPSPPWNDWQFWQYSDSGTVAGIPSAVDLDKFNGTREDLMNLVGGGPPPDAASAGDAAGAPSDLAGAVDAGGGGDGAGGRGDAGRMLPSTPAHCGCRVGAAPGRPTGLLSLGLLLAALAIRRARAR